MKIICFEPYFHRGTLEHERTQLLRYLIGGRTPDGDEVVDIEPQGGGAVVRFRSGRELRFPMGTLETAGGDGPKSAPRNEVTVRWNAVGAAPKPPEPPKPPAALEPEVRALMPEPIPGDPVGPPSGPVIPDDRRVTLTPSGAKPQPAAQQPQRRESRR